MSTAENAYLNTIRTELTGRKLRLESALSAHGSDHLRGLLDQVDSAIERLDEGSYGVCEVCHDSIEIDRLIADPIITVCLDHLSEREQRALERDLELAAQLQTGTLPSREVHFPGWNICFHYQPASIVSGDYCDLIPQGDHLYFVVADVSGKGVAAAMLSANLRALFRALIPIGMPTQELMTRASALFHESKMPSQYATVIAGRISRTGELEFSNAGHPPVLLATKSDITTVTCSDLPLGMFARQEFGINKLSLTPGELIVLYTDGISEAVNQSDEEYGVEKLSTVLRNLRHTTADEIINGCRQNLLTFRSGRERVDDETILAMQYAPGHAAGA